MTLYHGGFSGLDPGERLVPSDPHVTDGCPICVARSQGRAFTVAQAREWARSMGDRGLPLLKMLADAPADAIVDAPSERRAVYVTSDLSYARWYAARSRGDLYEVRVDGAMEPSGSDHFPAWTTEAAIVTRVIERNVRLKRRDRRELQRRWAKADRRAAGVTAVTA